LETGARQWLSVDSFEFPALFARRRRHYVGNGSGDKPVKMPRHALPLVFIFVATLFARALAAAEPLNVVLILVDDLGSTDMGYTGSDTHKTPNIDKLAAESVRFTTAYAACTVCSPTRAALMSGKYPARLHVTDWIPGHVRAQAKLRVPEWTMHLPLEEVTLAEVLKPKGYATASIGKWHLGDEQFWPTAQGFDINIAGTHKGQPPSYFAPYKIPTLQPEGNAGEYLPERESLEACKFIEANKEKNFFLYLPCHLVHTPLQGKPEVVAQYKAIISETAIHKNPVYAAMIQALDEEVGTVLKKLDALNLREKTVVIFASDNGGLIGSTRNPPFRAGKGSAYEGGVRTPLLICAPGFAPGVCAEPVITMDLYPTVAELSRSGAAVPPMDGLSLVPLLKNPEATLERDALYWHYPHYHPGGATPYSAIRSGNYRLVEFYEDGHQELYNLANDVSETNDLAQKEPSKLRELKSKLDAWRASVGAQPPSPNPDYDPDAPNKGKPNKSGQPGKDGKKK
jgi:arylsulfatase A